jgi:hypothetical protein
MKIGIGVTRSCGMNLSLWPILVAISLREAQPTFSCQLQKGNILAFQE